MINKRSKKISFILAGGKGVRLWPLSRENYPKQFVEFKRGLSLFQFALKRSLALCPAQNVYVITGGNYKFTVFNQIDATQGLSRREKDQIKQNIIFEPKGRSTAPAIMLGLKYLQEKIRLDLDSIVYVLPSDQIIEPVRDFVPAMVKASGLALAGRMVVFGIKPAGPQTGYGYIVAGKKNGQGFSVKRFVEKPSRGKALGLIKQGGLWNSGMFCFTPQVFLDELKRFRPRIHGFYGFSYQRLVKGFSRVPDESIDYAIMQNTDKASCVALDLRWSDLGSWDSFSGFHARRDANGGVGRAEFLDCGRCFVYSQKRLIAMVGVDDLIVVDSPDAILVTKRGCSDKVKKLIAGLNKKREALVKDSSTVYRPWGYYSVLQEGGNYKVKEISIYPKKFISLQTHTYRSEHWNVVEGQAEIFIGKRRQIVKRNESVFVPKHTRHKIYNPGSQIVKIIEVQIGSYLGEDDIKRYSAYE